MEMEVYCLENSNIFKIFLLPITVQKLYTLLGILFWHLKTGLLLNGFNAITLDESLAFFKTVKESNFFLISIFNKEL